MATISERSKRCFAAEVRARGDEYFRQKRVRANTVDDDLVKAVVRGSGGRYAVKMEQSDVAGEVLAMCDCPYFDSSGLCKHIWAVLRHLDGVKPPPEMLADDGPLTIVDGMIDDDYDDDDDDDYESADDAVGNPFAAIVQDLIRSAPPQARAILSEQIRKHDAKRKVPAKPVEKSWQTKLRAVEQPTSEYELRNRRTHEKAKPREVWYVFDVDRTMASGRPAIRWMHRERRQTGTWGKIKPLNLRYGDLDAFQPAADGELLRLLRLCDSDEGYGYRGYDPGICMPAVEAFDWVFPRLAATGRFVWTKSIETFDPENPQRLTWDDGPTRSFAVRVTENLQAGEWLLDGVLTRPDGSPPLPLLKTTMIAGGGLVLADGKLGRVDISGCEKWIKLFYGEPVIVVPDTDRVELVRKLWRDARVPVLWPAELQVEETLGVPQGKLRIVRGKERWTQDRLYAELKFDYGGQLVDDAPTPAGLVSDDGRRVVRRDFQAEQAMVARMTSLGVQVNTRTYADPAPYCLPEKKLSEVVEQLSVDGWNVEAEGYRFRQATAARLSVDSGVDWFDLSGTFEFGDASVDLPTLLAAIRSGERYVKLGKDGRGLLPEEWLKRYRTLAESTDAADGATVRFPSGQALLLDALLAEQPEVDVDQKFAACRERLNQARAASPAEAPRTFEGTLRDYQKAGLGWLHFLRDVGLGGCLADDMGLGKTIQVLALLEGRRTRRVPKGESRSPSLVVAPKTLIFNWLDEARRFTPKLRVLNLTGIERAEHWESLGDYDLVLTTYGTLRRDAVRLNDVRFDYVILDEAQAIKTADSQSAKACRLLQAEHRLVMTGTPIENRLTELWSLFEFLNPGLLGRSAAFGRMSAGDAEGRAVIARCVAPLMLRRTKQQVLTELPEKTEQTLYCELPPKQRKLYDELRDYYRQSLLDRVEKTGLAKAKIHVLESLLRLRQAACHPALVDPAHADLPSAKLEALDAQLDEVLAEKHKALIFSQFTSLLSLVRKRLDARGVVYEYLDGKTRDRAARVERFQTDESCGAFLISLKAGGCGLNLTAADYVFILDPWWNPAVEAQAVDRAHRLGQQRSVSAYRLIARGTVEEKILELQASKRELADSIVRADDGVLKRLTVDDLRNLLS